MRNGKPGCFGRSPKMNRLAAISDTEARRPRLLYAACTSRFLVAGLLQRMGRQQPQPLVGFPVQHAHRLELLCAPGRHNPVPECAEPFASADGESVRGYGLGRQTNFKTIIPAEADDSLARVRTTVRGRMI